MNERMPDIGMRVAFSIYAIMWFCVCIFLLARLFALWANTPCVLCYGANAIPDTPGVCATRTHHPVSGGVRYAYTPGYEYGGFQPPRHSQ